MPNFTDDLMKKLLGMALSSASIQSDLDQLLLDRGGAPVTVTFYIHDNKLEVEINE